MIKSFVKAAVCVAAFAAANAQAISVLDTATYNGHTYSLLSDSDWLASEAFAVSMGGHLVAVNEAAENNFLNQKWGQYEMPLWIGLERTAPHSPTFVWTNGDAVTFTNWAGGEPNDAPNVPAGEQYVHTYSNGQWNDLDNFNGYAGPKYGVMEVSAVPEPETFAMLLAGLGLVGAVARRRKAK